MIDHGEADDKIIAVLDNDHVWGHARKIHDVPAVFTERSPQAPFPTYKLVPGERAKVRIAQTYGRGHALRVVRAAMADYQANFVQ